MQKSARIAEISTTSQGLTFYSTTLYITPCRNSGLVDSSEGTLSR